ncbi:MAG: FeoB-associated Cys-rich membrane protein [Senegalia sp. (in: firmicutes)]|uniref:FeoB-associated Cys-rich membrane protein n=1 Tax=Senegalia sp. (in: firmicutes) TaxID=1924098 RepID=UPI003F975B7E
MIINIIVALIILTIIGLSISKIVKEKKRGAKCIGCPHAGPDNKSCNYEANK